MRLLFLMLCAANSIAAAPIRVLIIDGVNNHDWGAATEGIRTALERTHRFQVTVSTTPAAQAPQEEWDRWRPDFPAYQVVISNFNGGHTDAGLRWPTAVEESFERYVRNGGGFVAYHAANNAFLNWREYNQMIGLGWRNKQFGPSLTLDGNEHVVVVPQGQGREPGHGPRHDFELVMRDPRHPITSGLPKRWMHPAEQLTHGQHGLPDLKPSSLTILSYAWSKDAKENEPLDWVLNYGKGRVYVTMLGHTWRNEDNPNLRDPGFQQLLARGTEWAATGGVAAIPETEWRKKILSTLHSPDPLPALEVKQHGKFSVEKGTQAERFSYRTQLGMRVPAIVYAPSAAPQVRRPAIIVVNGHGGDKFSWYAMYTGMAYARLGAVVLTYDPLGEGERNAKLQSGTRAHDRVVQPEEMGRYMGGLMLTDVRQAVSYLASRPDVDATRIAAVGYSMGSFVLSVACAAETRLRACVLVGGGNLDGPGEYWDGSKPMCQGIPYRSLAFLGDRPAALYSLHALRGATLIYNGDADTVVNIPKKGQTYLEEVRRATIALSGKNEVFDIDFVKGTSHRPYFVTKPVAIWLHRYLHFSHADLEKIPVQRIAGWAREHNVEMDKLYATYDREGGTPALFNDIPALTRAQLRVFSEKDWQAARGELIYESWVEKARLRLTPPPSSRTGSTPER